MLVSTRVKGLFSYESSRLAHMPTLFPCNQQAPVGIFLFLLLPQILSKWIITGAFELFLDGEEIFSKLSRGGFPTSEELIQILGDHGLQTQSAA